MVKLRLLGSILFYWFTEYATSISVRFVEVNLEFCGSVLEVVTTFSDTHCSIICSRNPSCVGFIYEGSSIGPNEYSLLDEIFVPNGTNNQSCLMSSYSVNGKILQKSCTTKLYSEEMYYNEIIMHVGNSQPTECYKAPNAITEVLTQTRTSTTNNQQLATSNVMTTLSTTFSSASLSSESIPTLPPINVTSQRALSSTVTSNNNLTATTTPATTSLIEATNDSSNINSTPTYSIASQDTIAFSTDNTSLTFGPISSDTSSQETTASTESIFTSSQSNPTSTLSASTSTSISPINITTDSSNSTDLPLNVSTSNLLFSDSSTISTATSEVSSNIDNLTTLTTLNTGSGSLSNFTSTTLTSGQIWPWNFSIPFQWSTDTTSVTSTITSSTKSTNSTSSLTTTTVTVFNPANYAVSYATCPTTGTIQCPSGSVLNGIGLSSLGQLVSGTCVYLGLNSTPNSNSYITSNYNNECYQSVGNIGGAAVNISTTIYSKFTIVCNSLSNGWSVSTDPSDYQKISSSYLSSFSWITGSTSVSVASWLLCPNATSSYLWTVDTIWPSELTCGKTYKI